LLNTQENKKHLDKNCKMPMRLIAVRHSNMGTPKVIIHLDGLFILQSLKLM
jgi:hypothetical protein